MFPHRLRQVRQTWSVHFIHTVEFILLSLLISSSTARFAVAVQFVFHGSIIETITQKSIVQHCLLSSERLHHTVAHCAVWSRMWTIGRKAYHSLEGLCLSAGIGMCGDIKISVSLCRPLPHDLTPDKEKLLGPV